MDSLIYILVHVLARGIHTLVRAVCVYGDGNCLEGVIARVYKCQGVTLLFRHVLLLYTCEICYRTSRVELNFLPFLLVSFS